MLTTTQIIKDAEYFKTGSAFFLQMRPEFRNAKTAIYKIEHFQEYQEPDSLSYQAFIAGDFEKSMELLADSHKNDIPLYKSLNERKVDFIRCRCVSEPVSQYLKWEFEHYKHNAKCGEKIYTSNVNKLYKNYVKHDFMVFDEKIAFIHNYNKNGLIQGGWKITNPKHIMQLSELFKNILKSSDKFNY